MATRKKKIVIMGDGAVGKSCFVNVFVGNPFPGDYDATIFDKYHFKFEVDGQGLEVELHDTAGQEEFKSLWDEWIREADAILLLYSVTEPSSFTIIQTELFPLIVETREEDLDRVPIALCGNKSDLPDHRVDRKMAEEYAKENGWDFTLASAINDDNVSYSFECLARRLLNAEPEPHEVPDAPSNCCCVIV